MSLQFGFPDHTKFVFSPTATHCSATMVSPEGMAYLSLHGDYLPHHISSREVFADSTAALLHEGGRVRAKAVKANGVAEKFEFILQTVTQWVSNGGLGRLDADREGGEKLYWEGLVNKNTSSSSDRVVCGRYGGDEIGRSVEK